MGPHRPGRRTHGARVVAYFFPPDVEGSYARNSARVGPPRIPDVGFYATVKKLQRPTLGDGFDEVVEVRLDGIGGFDVRPTARLPYVDADAFEDRQREREWFHSLTCRPGSGRFCASTAEASRN